MAIDSYISGSGVAEHHDKDQATISEVAIGESQGHASDSASGSGDLNHHEKEIKQAEGERQ